MLQMFKSFWTDESGQGLTEYAVIIALVSVGLLAILIAFRGVIGQVFRDILTALEGQSPSQEPIS